MSGLTQEALAPLTYQLMRAELLISPPWDTTPEEAQAGFEDALNSVYAELRALSLDRLSSPEASVTWMWINFKLEQLEKRR